jgi:hypothetical protein
LKRVEFEVGRLDLTDFQLDLLAEALQEMADL